MLQRWPSRIWIVRHGESAGNVARDAAHEAGLARIDIAERDVDVPLSDRGRQQADALGRWFAEMPDGGAPERGADLALPPGAADRCGHPAGPAAWRRTRPTTSSTSGCARRSSGCSTG